ncbi:MAG: sensor histidine kinase, partial [Betaproteobacteria bacterium]|nr:sensor histidine kinase [Betaproteobacteria bacterium]
MKSLSFVLRRALAFCAAAIAFLVVWRNTIDAGPRWAFGLLFFIALAWVVAEAFSHVRRVRLITDSVDAASLENRHRRQIEIPFPAAEAFDLVDATIREMPRVKSVESARDSLQVRARLTRVDPYGSGMPLRMVGMGALEERNDLVRAVVTPGQGTASATLICEPEGGPWLDWFFVDHGTNLENAEAVTRAITRRVAERRKQEQENARQSEVEKELTVAKLNLLHAQVEPHFLYNTLASAQVLTRSDPARADLMLGHLITYLRNSLPRAEDSPSTLGEELDRARAYLGILRIRMGERLAVQVQVPDELRTVPLPPMMLQTLVENAIKHGLEPVTGGGNIWILAKA